MCADERFDKSFDERTGYRTRSMLSVPIVHERTGNVLGCLQCLNKANDYGEQVGVYFSEEEDFPLITAFSQVLALVCDPRKNVAWKVQRYGVVRPRPVHW